MPSYRPFFLFCAILFVASVPPLPAQPFPLSDSGPGAPDFRERFLGNYGVNSAIEPEVGEAGREVYREVASELRNAPESALRKVRAKVRSDSGPALHFLLGALRYQTGRTAAAERSLRRAVEAFPDFRRAHRILGLIRIQERRFPEAVDSWLKVITLGGGDAQSYGLLGYAYLSLERYASALRAYEMARMYRPDSVDFRRGEAQSLLQTGQTERAIALFDELIAEDPAESAYWRAQANAHIRREAYDAALANLEILLTMDALDAGDRRLLADLHMRAGNGTLAAEHYLAALDAAETVDAEEALRPVPHLTRRGLLEEADRYLERLRTKVGEAADADTEAAITLAEARIAKCRGEPEAAAELLRPLVESRPMHGEALLLLGRLHREMGDYESAAMWLERALAAPDTGAEARIALGRLEVGRGNFAAALEHLRAARRERNRAGLDEYIESVEAAREQSGG